LGGGCGGSWRDALGIAQRQRGWQVKGKRGVEALENFCTQS